MAKTSTERMREYRERQKLVEKVELPKPKPQPVVNSLLSNPGRSFAAFIEEQGSNFMLPENLAWVGIELQTDLKKNEPTLDHAEDWKEMGLEVNSLTVATAMREILIDAAKELSSLINTYKLEEIDRQMENASPVKKAQLEALKARLAKKTSHFFPVID